MSIDTSRQVHRLKTLCTYWTEVATGDKTVEIRKDDRNFQNGDILVLLEVDLSNKPTGRQIVKRARCVYHRVLGLVIGYVLIELADEDAVRNDHD